jgi:hypothetical protein
MLLPLSVAAGFSFLPTDDVVHTRSATLPDVGMMRVVSMTRAASWPKE